MKKKAKRTLDKYAFGTGFSSVGSVPTPAGIVNEVSSDFLAKQAMQGLGFLFGSHDKSGSVDDAIIDNTGNNLIMGFGGVVDDPTKPLKLTTKPRPVQPDITLPNWDGLVQKADGSVGMWGNDIVQTVPTVPVTPALPVAKTDHLGRQSGSYYQGTKTTSDKILEMEKKLKASSNMKGYGLGGVVNRAGVPVEVEGNEVGQLPNGDLLNFEGPSHEAGGIDATLPAGTAIYSDRISIDGKTMAERKKSRESKIKKLSKYLDSNPSDVINKQTFERSRMPIDAEEQQDLMIQQVANQSQKRFAKGGIIPYPDVEINPFDFDVDALEGLKSDSANILSNQAITEDVPTNLEFAMPPKPPVNTDMAMTTGDITGLISSAIGGVAPLATTIANRAGDKPNINAYKNFGNDALLSNRKAMGTLAASRDSALQDAELQETAVRHRNRNSASSVSTLRSLDFTTDAMADSAENNIYNSFNQQMMGLYGQQAQLENQQDSVVMRGEQGRDEADRVDRDSFYTNLGQNLINLTNTGQKTAKDLNEAKYRNDLLALMPELSKYGLGFVYDESGKPILTQVK